MILSNDEIKSLGPRETIPGVDDYTSILKISHLEANARIRALEAENRCLEMRLEDCRLEAEGVAVYIHEATNAENRADRLAVIADALAVEGFGNPFWRGIFALWRAAALQQRKRIDRAEAKLQELYRAVEVFFEDSKIEDNNDPVPPSVLIPEKVFDKFQAALKTAKEAKSE